VDPASAIEALTVAMAQCCKLSTPNDELNATLSVGLDEATVAARDTVTKRVRDDGTVEVSHLDECALHAWSDVRDRQIRSLADFILTCVWVRGREGVGSYPK
jgi:hypothetical protein